MSSPPKRLRRLPPLGAPPAARQSLIRGGSCIIAPMGQVLAGPHTEGETILTAEVDLADIARGKYDFDVAGHYARPDVFRLVVNERPTPAVVYDSSDITDRV